VAAQIDVDWDGHRTACWLLGDDGDDRPMALVLHGGPGLTHEYVLPLALAIAGDGRRTVVYDQIGNGSSDHLPGADAAFWTPELFVRELQAVVDRFSSGRGHHVLGQSWGGMVAIEYALHRPPGLRSLVLLNTPSSMPVWASETRRLRKLLPADVLNVLDRCEATGTTDVPEYQEAVAAFYERHFCSIPWPEELVASFTAIEADPTVYRAMWGESEFEVTGLLRDWDVTGRLGELNAPTLLISGEHDLATPKMVEEMERRIPGSRRILVADASHLSHLEQPDRVVEPVHAFLAESDSHDV
jgi:L-proline amide hydrolase